MKKHDLSFSTVKIDVATLEMTCRIAVGKSLNALQTLVSEVQSDLFHNKIPSSVTLDAIEDNAKNLTTAIETLDAVSKIAVEKLSLDRKPIN